MKITFKIESNTVDESVYLSKFKEDWNYTRKPRSDRGTITFTASNRMYYIATILTPKEHKGKLAGYCGYGIYSDVLIEQGSYSLGGLAVKQEGSNAVDLRGNGVYTTLRNHRNAIVEKMADERNVPFIVLLGLKSTAHDYYRNRGYVENSENIPEWCLNKMKGTGKTWFVYNENVAMKKAWDILKIMQPPKRNNLSLKPPKSEGHIPKVKDMNLQFQISRDKDDKCDYCHRPAVLDCKKCEQKLCQRHLSKPCKTGDGDYRYG